MRTLARVGQLRIKHFTLMARIAELGSLRKAAEAMHISQPAATQMLRDIEAAFGIQVVERTYRGSGVREAATELVSRSRVLLNEVESLARTLSENSAQGVRLLRLGLLPRCVPSFLPGIARHFSQHMPTVRIRLTEARYAELVQSLTEGELDAIIARRFPSSTDEPDLPLASMALLSDGISIVQSPPAAPEEAPAEPYSLLELQGRRWVLPSRGRVTRRVFDETFLNEGLSPPLPAVESNTIVATMELVAGTDMLGLLPSDIAVRLSAAGTLRILSLPLSVSLPPIALIWRSSTADTEAVKQLKIHLQTVRKAGLPAS